MKFEIVKEPFVDVSTRRVKLLLFIHENMKLTVIGECHSLGFASITTSHTVTTLNAIIVIIIIVSATFHFIPSLSFYLTSLILLMILIFERTNTIVPAITSVLRLEVRH